MYTPQRLPIDHRNPIWAPAFPCEPLLFTK